jgi:hypothetical protein
MKLTDACSVDFGHDFFLEEEKISHDDIRFNIETKGRRKKTFCFLEMPIVCYF